MTIVKSTQCCYRCCCDIQGRKIWVLAKTLLGNQNLKIILPWKLGYGLKSIFCKRFVLPIQFVKSYPPLQTWQLSFQAVNLVCVSYSMLTLELSSYVLENPNDAHITLSSGNWLAVHPSVKSSASWSVNIRKNWENNLENFTCLFCIELAVSNNEVEKHV